MSLRTAITSATLALTLTACQMYHMPVQQGNIIDAKAASKIHKGMSSKQVVAQLGSPVLQTPFESNKLIYVYTLRPSEGHKLHKRLEITLKHSKVVSKQLIVE